MKSDLRGLNGVEELFGARGMLSARVFTNRLENDLMKGESVYEMARLLSGMLRPLTYISGFFREAQYVVPSAVRLRATCLVSQARISLTSLRNRTIDLECAQKKRVIQPRRELF